MLRTAYDLLMISLFGFVKVTLFFLFFCISILFFAKSNDLALDEKPAFAGLLVNPDGGHLKPGYPADKDGEADKDVLRLEEMTPQEAEIYFFILRLSESINQPNARKLAKLIVKECSNYDNLDPYLILAVIQVESEFSPKAKSKRGAIGLMQVMPGTAEYIAKEMGVDYDGKKSLYDPFVNVKLGIHYLSLLTDRYDSMENALDAYNYGPSNFEKAQASDSGRKPSRYTKKVMNFKNYLEEESLLLAKSS
ncbi:MAG: lytic transglycosylase domain-containing protein [Candidatus Dadabacteria bacterium]|nr:MAG: lytic transglycosylase domain-containing protein [Candidatus Dadabacteria bacterium]